MDLSHFQLCQMDTDSLYMALHGSKLKDVKPEKRQEFYEFWPKWFPAEACDDHHPDFVETKCRGDEWKPTKQCCIRRRQFEKRTPGKMKTEWSGSCLVSLSSKTYYGSGEMDKLSCKGLNKNLNNLTKERYLDVLTSKKSACGTNRGFRSRQNEMYTYSEERDGLNYLYLKRIVGDDGITTSPTLL